MTTNTSPETKTSHRRLSGTVVSAAMQKAVVVRIDRQVPHKKYGKYFTISKKVKVRDGKGEAHVGDLVEIEETRPLSKDICWKFVKTVKVAKPL